MEGVVLVQRILCQNRQEEIHFRFRTCIIERKFNSECLKRELKSDEKMIKH